MAEPQPAAGSEPAAGSVLISTHDLSLAARVADLVCLLNGRQYAAGTPADTLTAGVLRRTYGARAVDLGDGRTVLVEP
jgi:manganese/iron transport system ATP-binding protein